MPFKEDQSPLSTTSPEEVFDISPMLMFFHYECGGRICKTKERSSAVFDSEALAQDHQMRFIVEYCVCDKCSREGHGHHVLHARPKHHGVRMSHDEQEMVTRKWVDAHPGFDYFPVIIGYLEFDDSAKLM